MLPTTFADATATADATFNTIAANKTWIKTVESQETFEKNPHRLRSSSHFAMPVSTQWVFSKFFFPDHECYFDLKMGIRLAAFKIDLLEASAVASP